MKIILFIAMSSVFSLLMAPLYGQGGISVFILERPDPFVFSFPEDFKKGVESRMTIAITAPPSFGPWNLLVSASGNLLSDGYSIPVSTISLQAVNKFGYGNNRKVRLSTKLQRIASRHSRKPNSEMEIVELKLKAKGGKQYVRRGGRFTTWVVFSLVQD